MVTVRAAGQGDKSDQLEESRTGGPAVTAQDPGNGTYYPGGSNSAMRSLGGRKT